MYMNIPYSNSGINTLPIHMTIKYNFTLIKYWGYIKQTKSKTTTTTKKTKYTAEEKVDPQKH